MTDYTRSTGNSGTMMIRDTGDWVEFWLNSNNSVTFNHQLPWSYDVNGSSGSGQYDYSANSGWQRLGSWYVTSSQTVTFNIGATGTSGFGGPTSFSITINRSTVPNPPTLSGPYNVSSSTCDVSITDNWNGGATIYTHQIGYGTDPWNVQYLSALSGYNTWISIGGLAAGTTYYFWARTWNQNGWSGWGNRVSTTTLRVPDAPSRPLLASVTASTVDVSFVPNGNGGSLILAYQVGYGVRSSGPDTTVGATSPVTITGLTPGTVYYFFVRAQNKVGWGPWSAANSVRTVAGAYVLVEVQFPTPETGLAQWKLAVVYVKVGGTWKLAEPWTRSVGVWQRTI